MKQYITNYNLKSKISNLGRWLRRNREKGLIISLTLLFILSSFAVYFYLNPKQSEAAWWNDNWQYRKRITYGNSDSAISSERKVLIEVDTAALTTAKLQADCDDIRFTDHNGRLLDYFIDTDAGACDTSSTDFYVKVDSVDAGTNTVYMYYGNPNANNVRKNKFYANGEMGEDLIGYWKMDESGANSCEGGSNDSCDSAYTNDASWQGGTTNDSGKIGNGTTLDGDGDYLDTGISQTFTNLTVTAWVKNDDISYSRDGSGVQSIAPKWANGNKSYDFRIGGGIGRLEVCISPGGDNNGECEYAYTLTDISTGVWTHVAFTYDDSANEVVIYNNGESVTYTNSVTMGGSPSIQPGRIQWGTTTDRNWKGDFDEFRVYNRTLSPEEILRIYNGGEGSSLPTPVTFIPDSGPTQASEETGPGPVAYWKFDEGADNTCPGGEDACDSTANAYDGVNTGGTRLAEGMCVSDKCLRYDGTDDYTQVSGYTKTIDTANVNYTISGWFKFNSLTDTGYFVYIPTASGTSYLGPSLFQESDKVSFYCGNSVSRVLSGSLTINSWYHFSGICNTDKTLQLYLNGERVAGDGSFTNHVNSAADFIRIGGNDNASRYATVDLDELKLYEYGRSESEIKEDYNRGAQVLGVQDEAWLSDGLVGYWPMDETALNTCGTNTDICDSSGNTKNLTELFNANVGASGKYGNATTLDGTGDTFCSDPDDDNTCEDDNSFDLGGSFTLAAWVKRGRTGAYDSFFSKYASGSNQRGYLFRFTSSNTIHLLTSDTVNGSGDNATFTTTNTYTDTSNWHHVVGVYDQAKREMKIYYDGIPQAGTLTGTVPASIANNTRYFAIGCGNSSSCISSTNTYSGNIDEARVYTRAFTPSEVSKLYQWAPGPVAHWKMDEGSWNNDCSTDTVFDSSGNGNDGDSCPNTSGPTGGAVGKYGKAGEFDGSDDYVQVTDDSSIQNAFDGGGTISAWIKVNSDGEGNGGRILEKTDSGSEGWYYYVFGESGGKTKIGLGQYFDSNLGEWDTTSTEVTNGVWTHVTAVYNNSSTGNNATIYVNGVSKAVTESSVPSGTRVSDSGNNLYVGNRSDGERTFDGQIDDIRIYNYARTPQQIVQDMNAGHPAPGSPVGSALGHWKFDEGYGDVAYDSSLQGNNGDMGGSGYTCPQSGSSFCPTFSSSGKFDKALSFDDTDDYVLIADDTSLDITGQITVSAWINATDATPTEAKGIVMKTETSGDPATDAYTLRLHTDGTIRFFGEDSSGNNWELFGNTVLQDNTWYHVSATWNNRAMAIYIDGRLDGTGTASYDMGTNNKNLFIGGNKVNDNQYFSGLIDEVKIFNSALTADQIKLLYNQGSASFGVLGNSEASDLTDGEGNPPIAHWSMDEGSWNNDCSTDTVFDISGSENHGIACPNSTGPTGNAIGKQGNAGYFDGSNDYVNLNSHLNNIEGMNTGTIEGWFRGSTTGTGQTFFSISDKDTTSNSMHAFIGNWTGAYADESFGFVVHRDGTTRFAAYVRKGHEYYKDNQWHHFAVSTGGGDNAIYIDGERQAVTFNVGSASTNEFSNISSADTMRIGSIIRSSGTYYFPGKIDGIKIFNYARSSAQVAYDYNRGKPIGYWKLDECQGVTAYDSGSGEYNGTIIPGGAPNTSAGTCSSGAGDEMWDDGTTGKRNASLGFDGTDDYVSLDSMSSDLSDHTEGTVSLWFKVPDTPGTTYRQFGVTDTATNDDVFQIYISSDDKLNFQFRDNDVNRYTGVTNNSLNPNQWYHVAMSTSSSGNTFYLDGDSTDYTYSTGSSANSQWFDNFGVLNGIRIGHARISSTNYPFKGQIDDVRIYNYSLSETQIRKIMNESAIRFGPSEGSP